MAATRQKIPKSRHDQIAVLGRRDVVRLAASASAAWLASIACPFAHGGQEVADLSARITRIIEEFDRQGLHRTGTDTDNGSAAWLADWARTAGAEVSLETFRLRRVDVGRAFLRSGEQRLEGVPMFDATFTGPDGMTGRLGPSGSEADIALVRLDAAGISAEGRPLGALRRAGRYKGFVIVTEGTRSGLSLTNAPAFESPFGPPALQVPSDERARLEALAAERSTIQLVVYADRTPAEASNVVAQLPGTDGSLPPLVVMTPRSGWWQCAAERGGGLACWLETIRTARSAKVPRTIHFLASSGHELGHLGLESFLARRADLIQHAAAWIHLGANIGAAGGRARVQASDDAIELQMLAALTRAGTDTPNRVARGTVPAGEARNIHVGGGRYVSALGSSAFFHNPADRWPVALDLPAVTRFARAIADLTVGLASKAT